MANTSILSARRRSLRVVVAAAAVDARWVEDLRADRLKMIMEKPAPLSDGCVVMVFFLFLFFGCRNAVASVATKQLADVRLWTMGFLAGTSLDRESLRRHCFSCCRNHVHVEIDTTATTS